ncbi:MAG: transporter substrate-binding domain-containing protein [Atopobiaceae bacterium]|nr:transporter substrate-binding domain-containing protein [Atopobiaceae bacterium]MCI2208339.1 transporter substrate-binding domain-containing protein [Atopobiaceae bacterium]
MAAMAAVAGLSIVGGTLSGCGGTAQAAGTSQAATDSSEPIRVGSEVAFAPYEWVTSSSSDTTVPIQNQSGSYADGYDVFWMRKIGEALGRDVVVVNMSFGGLISALNQGQVDMVISGMADTAERRESVAFSDAYKSEKDNYGLMVRSDSVYANGTTINDFAGASVLGQKSSPLDTVIDQIPGVNHMTPVEHVPEQLTQLENGTVDAITVSLDNTPGYLETYPDLKVIRFPEGQGLDPGFDGTCVALRKEDTDLLAQVNEVIASVSAEDNAAEFQSATDRQPA